MVFLEKQYFSWEFLEVCKLMAPLHKEAQGVILALMLYILLVFMKSSNEPCELHNAEEGLVLWTPETAW